MINREREIIDRCVSLGIDQHGLASIRNFIKAAFYHVSLAGTLPADVHVAFNTAIRFATNRIACQGRDGDSRTMARLLSRRAIERRDAILFDDGIPPGLKLGRWRTGVTEEHQDPAAAVQKWIEDVERELCVDEVVLRLLRHPSVVITREEELRIPREYRWSGDPALRYERAGIEVVRAEGTATFYRNSLWPERSPRPRKYRVTPLPFDT